MNTGPSSYDELPYGDNCFSSSHPDYLATLARLHGLVPPALEGCRVLELGCARGGNLVPMALENPTGQFVGVDLSTRQVDEARQIADELGLRNVELHALDLTRLDDRFGTFDFIVCHGVFSWVPEPVRDAVLSICRDRLAPNGIAYVSYNTYPGWHGRGMVRELLGYHSRRPGSPLEQVERARGFLEELVRVLPDKGTSHARILATEREMLRGVADSYLYHEHLEETNQPLYFHQFMARAQAKGLRFVAEAHTPALIAGLPGDARAALDQWAEDELAAEQYLDFLVNRTFRRTLLSRGDEGRTREADPARVAGLWASTYLAPVSERPDTRSESAEEFRRGEDGSSLSTNSPVSKTALVELHRVRPQALAFDDLCGRVTAALGPAAPGTEEVRSTLQAMLLRCFLWDLAALHTRPPRFAPRADDRPRGSPLARIQARAGGRVTTLRRRSTELTDYDRMVLLSLDGARDRGAVLSALLEAVGSGEFSVCHGDEPVADPEVVREVLQAELGPSLDRLAALALLAVPGD